MKIKNLLILCISVITLSSCAFTEEIHVKNDGSGSYNFKMDLGQMMAAMGDMGTKNDSIKKKKPEKQDTIIQFKDVLEEMKDSIKTLSSDERAMLESLRDLKMRIKMDEEKKEMNMDFIYDFKNLSDLKNMSERIEKAQALGDKKKQQQSDAFKSNSDVSYSFKNKTFKRNVTLKKQTDAEKESYNKYLEQSAAMFEGSTYKIVYHFESKVKSVSIDEAKISADGKTVTLEMPFDKVMKDPLLLNFEVKLK